MLCASGALAVGGLAPAAPASAATPAAAGPVSADSAKVLSGSSPSWAEPATDQGAAPAGATRTARVLLAGRDAAGLADYAEQVSSPGSAVYAKYLTTAQVERQYGSSAQQLAAVKKWLAGAGLTVTGSSTGGFTDYLTVSGPAKAVDAAFHTSLHRYRVGSAVRTAPSSDARVPAAVSGAVLGVTGLSDLQPTAHAGATRSTAGTTGTASPAQSAAGESGGSGSFPTSATCSAYWGEKKVGGTGPATYNKDTPYDQCSLVPKQLRKAYGVSAGGLTGKGARVAVVDAYGSSTMESDADTYAAGHGDQPFRSGQYTEVKDPSKWTNQAACGGPAGWAPEEALDVEMVHGLAPDANVVYVGADSCLDSDLYDALDTIVSKHLADVVSNSWGEIMHTTDGQDVAASEIASYTQLFQRGAVEGIGFDFSAGDCGDSSPLAAASGANCQTDTARAQANWPDSSPWVTAVGGTALGLKDSSGGYGFETDMGTHRSALSADGGSWTPFPAPFYFGGGGGTSEDFAQPWYQAGHVPASLSHTLMTGQKSSTARRVTPDVALNGDLYTSVLVGISDGAPYSEAGYGGTSVSAPEFSAVQADAIQARHGLPVGFADPELYARQHAGVFRDVVNDRARAGRPPLDSVYDAGVVNGRPVVRLVTFGQDTSLVATSGYDDATGLGSPTAAYLDSFR